MKRIIPLIIAGALLAGCQSQPQKPQKAEALDKWNSARANVLVGLANDQFNAGNFEKARQTVDEALGMDKQNAPLYVMRGRIAIEQNRLEDADAAMKDAIKVDAKCAEAWYYSGVVAQRWQRYDDALTAYSLAAEAKPSEEAYLLAKVETLVLLNRRGEAITTIQDKIVYFEHSATLRDTLGQILMQESRPKEAAECYRQARVLASDDLAIGQHLAMALMQSGQHREAIDQLATLATLEGGKDRSDLYMMIGECQLHLEHPTEARTAFSRACELDGAALPGWLGQAKASMQLQDWRRAEIAIQKAISLDRANVDATLMLGFLRLRQDDLHGAMDAFIHARDLNPKDTVAICMIGMVFQKQGKREQAIECYQRALQINPQDELATRLTTIAE